MVIMSDSVSTLNLSIPSEILLALWESENELCNYMKRQAALGMFQSNKLSVGQSAGCA